MTELQLTALNDIARATGEVGPAFAPLHGANVVVGPNRFYVAGHEKRGGTVGLYVATYESLVKRDLIKPFSQNGQNGHRFVAITRKGKLTAAKCSTT